MSQQNLISVSLSEEEKSSIDEAIATLTTTLLPKLKSLQPEDRQELPKMGDKTVAFVTKASEYCQQNPDLVPPYLDIDELITFIQRKQETYRKQ